MQQIKQVTWYDQHHYEVELEDGKKDYFASVTTKLQAISSPWLASWRGQLGNVECDRILKESQVKGSRIHKAFETYVKSGTVIVRLPYNNEYTDEEIKDIAETTQGNYFVIEDQDEALAFWRLTRFLGAVKPEILDSERMVYSLKHREAGTADGVLYIKSGTYEINGSKPVSLPEGKYVVDIKSGKSVSETAYLQMSAYTHMMEEMGIHSDIVGALVLHTGSQNRKAIEGFATHYISRGEIDEYYKVYRNASEVWKWQNKNSTSFRPRIFNLPTKYTLK